MGTFSFIHFAGGIARHGPLFSACIAGQVIFSASVDLMTWRNNISNRWDVAKCSMRAILCLWWAFTCSSSNQISFKGNFKPNALVHEKVMWCVMPQMAKLCCIQLFMNSMGCIWETHRIEMGSKREEVEEKRDLCNAKLNWPSWNPCWGCQWVTTLKRHSLPLQAVSFEEIVTCVFQ